MTESPVPGWYNDPNRPNEKRWWDGESWTQHFREFRPDVIFDSTPPPQTPTPSPTPAPTPVQTQAQTQPQAAAPSSTPTPPSDHEPNLLDQYVRALKEKVWLRWVTGIVVLTMIGLVGSIFEEPKSDTTASSQPAPAPASTPADADSGDTAPAEEPPAEPAPAEPKKLSSKERVEAALEDIDGPVETPVINDVEFGSDALTITAATPEGGLQGASTGDLNDQAAAIFQAVYGDAKYKKTDTVIVFQGGLVDTRTGKDADDVNTGIYTMPRSDAREIDWSDQDTLDVVIDWTLFRDFVHPALKKDD